MTRIYKQEVQQTLKSRKILLHLLLSAFFYHQCLGLSVAQSLTCLEQFCVTIKVGYAHVFNLLAINQYYSHVIS